jgi:aminoglycoside phosphotransferase (APT) family kinase protein
MTSFDNIALTTPAGLTALLDDLLSTDPSPDHDRPPLTYLRRKAGRGMVAVYGTARNSSQIYTVTVDEVALNAAAGGGPATPIRPAWQGSWPGLVEEPVLGLRVQAFPADLNLPALAAAMAPADHRALWDALQSAGRQTLPETGAWTLVSAEAEPVRYKPGDRCVIRYRLGFERPGTDGPEQATSSVIGKLYRESGQAEAAGALLTRLRSGTEGSWSPAPLGAVDALALLLSEDLGTPCDVPPTLAGTDVIHPSNDRAHSAIALAAQALADLHTSSVADADTTIRSGADEAIKAGKRALVLSNYLPGLAQQIDRVSAELCQRLKGLQPDLCMPAHGSYKPSQLLVRDGAVFLVDFDQFCLADPALDVGYFLAYLRPPGFWHSQAGTRDWFHSAAETFRSAYTAALTRRGIAPSACSSILERAAVYEAALLMKIAARRPNRLHSPRPAEVQAVLNEISGCLAQPEMANSAGR